MPHPLLPPSLMSVSVTLIHPPHPITGLQWGETPNVVKCFKSIILAFSLPLSFSHSLLSSSSFTSLLSILFIHLPLRHSISLPFSPLSSLSLGQWGPDGNSVTPLGWHSPIQSSRSSPQWCLCLAGGWSGHRGLFLHHTLSEGRGGRLGRGRRGGQLLHQGLLLSRPTPLPRTVKSQHTLGYYLDCLIGCM